MSKTKRWGVILLLLGATLVAVAKVSGGDDVVEIRAVNRPVSASASLVPAASEKKPGATDELRVTMLTPRTMDGDIDSLFVVPPKPTPVIKPATEKLAAPEAPQAPPLPLRLLGRMTENGVQVLFLTWNDLHLAAHVGDVIEETYRLESIAGGQAEFVYLPLKIKQSLSVGEDS